MLLTPMTYPATFIPPRRCVRPSADYADFYRSLDAASLFVVICHGNDFHPILVGADEKGAIFHVQPERIDSSMLRFKQFGVQGWMGGVVFKQCLGFFPFPGKAVFLDISVDVVSEFGNNRHFDISICG